MADRYPLVVASGVVQELAASDNLDLTDNNIVGLSSISVSGIGTFGTVDAGIATFTSAHIGILTVTQIADDFFSSRVENLSGIATHYTAGLSTADFQYSGGTYTPDGKIYYSPWSANSYYVYDTITGIGQSVVIADDIAGDSHVEGGALYAGGVLAANNCIYFIPYYASSVYKLDTRTGTGSTIAITGVGTTGTYHGGILASSGKIYGAPHSANAWLIIDPTTDSCERVNIGISSLNYPGNFDAGQNWLGCVESPEDGCIHAIPFSTSVVLKYDPNSGISTNYGDYGKNIRKWRGGVFYQGEIFCAPDSENYIAVLDPVGLTTTGIGTAMFNVVGGSKYQGICAGPDGYLYAKPYLATNVLRIDPHENTAYTIGANLRLGSAFPSSATGHGGVVDSNGRLYLAPYGKNGITITQLYSGRPSPYLLSPYSNYSH